MQAFTPARAEAQRRRRQKLEQQPPDDEATALLVKVPSTDMNRYLKAIMDRLQSEDTEGLFTEAPPRKYTSVLLREVALV
jgi:hypothetical protein